MPKHILINDKNIQKKFMDYKISKMYDKNHFIKDEEIIEELLNNAN